MNIKKYQRIFYIDEQNKHFFDEQVLEYNFFSLTFFNEQLPC